MRCDCGYTFATGRIVPVSAVTSREPWSSTMGSASIVRSVWVLPLIGAIVGIVEFISAWGAQDSSPKQAALAAFAIAWAVIPYCLARAIIGIVTARAD